MGAFNNGLLKSFVAVLALCVLGVCLILEVYQTDIYLLLYTMRESRTRTFYTSQYWQSPGVPFGTNATGETNNFINPVWEPNKTALAELRSHLKPLETAKTFVLSQESLSKKRRLPLMFPKSRKLKKRTYYVQDATKDSQPKVSPFADRSLGVCSLVGNSGILIGSNCGHEIDSADFVIRFNMPPVCPPYLEDIGRRTDLVTTSRDRMSSKYGMMKSHSGQEKFLHQLHDQYGQDTFLVGAPFTIGKDIKTFLSLPGLLRSYNSSVVSLLISPSHVIRAIQIWKELGLTLHRKINLSSGFYYTSVALELCDQVNIYGFWPFRDDQAGKPVQYHYYKSVDTGGLKNRWHEMDREFEKLQELHNLGVLQLRYGSCR